MSTALPSPTIRPAENSSTYLRVVAKEAVAEGTVVLALAAPDGVRLPDWAPAAHIDLHLGAGRSGSTPYVGTDGTPPPIRWG